eukprot:m.288233 g.288233  ORF g.288233 m.288233 type:complete len:80 (+) comp15799_c0_seq2:5835-6074(+)
MPHVKHLVTMVHAVNCIGVAGTISLVIVYCNLCGCVDPTLCVAKSNYWCTAPAFHGLLARSQQGTTSVNICAQAATNYR